jgi:hypothetical protein
MEDHACAYSDADLRSCVTISSGIYGVGGEHLVCTTSDCGGQGPSAYCYDGVTISAAVEGVEGGAPAIATVHQGIYSLALEPATYEVCPHDPVGCTSTSCIHCVVVTIHAGELVRVDRSDESGTFGTIAFVTVR